MGFGTNPFVSQRNTKAQKGKEKSSGLNQAGCLASHIPEATQVSAGEGKRGLRARLGMLLADCQGRSPGFHCPSWAACRPKA